MITANFRLCYDGY